MVESARIFYLRPRLLLGSVTFLNPWNVVFSQNVLTASPHCLLGTLVSSPQPPCSMDVAVGWHVDACMLLFHLVRAASGIHVYNTHVLQGTKTVVLFCSVCFLIGDAAVTQFQNCLWCIVKLLYDTIVICDGKYQRNENKRRITFYCNVVFSKQWRLHPERIFIARNYPFCFGGQANPLTQYLFAYRRTVTEHTWICEASTPIRQNRCTRVYLWRLSYFVDVTHDMSLGLP